MQVLVVLGHQNPNADSFCHAICDVAVQQLKSAGHDVIVHDLYAEGFDPVLKQSELAKDAQLDPIIQKHCDEVVAADGFVVIHPNWWGQPPAIVKGWLDRVFRQGVVYHFGDKGAVVGHLKDKTAVVITTSNTPREMELEVFGDPLENLWDACVFRFCGVTDFKRRNFESIVMSTEPQRKQWLDETRELIADKFPA